MPVAFDMPAAFAESLPVPAGHALREVRRAPRGAAGEVEWEHEERDARGMLVAVHESRTRPGGAGEPPAVVLAWTKYSPAGWVLARAGWSAPPPWPPAGGGWPPPRPGAAAPP